MINETTEPIIFVLKYICTLQYFVSFKVKIIIERKKNQLNVIRFVWQRQNSVYRINKIVILPA